MSNGDHLTRNRGAIRFLLLALGVPQALIGLWALFGRPPGDLAEDRYLEAWADSALRLLETHGLLEEAATKEARR